MGSVDLSLLLIFLQGVHGLPVPGRMEPDRLLRKPLDITSINGALGLDLHEGDIKMNMNMGRSEINGDQFRWPRTVPYYLDDSLEMNAKGAILKAIERFRLKTCIDFKPWENETNYVKVFKGTGCYSYVGNLQRGEQTVSIGDWCDSVEIVQHEFVHMLGFYHEQTRSDRDDYVTIIWDNIKPGYEGIFGKGTAPSFLNVPYDYASLMHYSMDAFGNGGPTILTKNPFFKTLIGGQMDLSEKDVQQINRLYNCTSSVTFLDSCSFELDNICGMVQNSEDNADWLYVSHVPAGPSTDRTYVGKATGYFMHYNTSTGNAGDKAMLESRLFYPKRGIQCLEFFYYNSGSENDELNIWIREYTGDSPNGTLRFINTVTGKPSDYWELHYAPIKTTNKFRFVFQGVKGTGYSNGGFSIDDINLSETECPHYVFHIRNFTHDVTKVGVVSPPYYSKDGYAYHISVWEYGDWVFGYSLHLVSGANDNSLQWPCPWRQVVVEIMDQQPNIHQRTSNVKTLTTDPNSRLSDSAFFWDNPSKVGQIDTYPNGTQYYVGPEAQRFLFSSKEWFARRDFAKGGDLFVLISMQDLSHLVPSQPTTTPPPVPTTTSID